MDATDKTIAEAEAEAEAIGATFAKWLFSSGEINGILTFAGAVNISAAFAAGWVGGREYNERRPK